MLARSVRCFQPLLARAPVRSFSVALPVWKEAEEPKDAVVPEAGFVDKSNPLHAPDSLQPWRNAGYSNLAPEGWTQWEDLPAPYKYYQVKVDPKDVEEPGMLYKLFTKWQTGIPLVTLLALPAFVYDVVLIDERFELMMIFWTTLAVVNASAGDGIKKMFQDQVDEVKTDLTTAEAKYEAAVAQAIDTHKKAMHVPSYLAMINEGERALRQVETAADSRAMFIEQRDRMDAMLDYLVMTRQARDAAIAEDVTAQARTSVEKLLMSDAKLQQSTIDNAVAALGKSARSANDTVVEDAFRAAYADAAAKAKKEQEAAGGVTAEERDLFARRFGMASTVTEEMLSKAEGNAAAMAVLTAQCGGATPEVGTKIVQKLPIDY